VLLVTDIQRKLREDVPYLIPESIRIAVQNADAIVALHPAAVAMDVDWEGGRYQLLGRTVLPVRLFDVQGGQLGRYGAVTLVSAEAPLLETRRLLLQGAVVASTDFRVRISDAQAQPVGALRDMTEVDGKEVVTTLPADTVLSSSMLRGIPDVRRGTLLTGILTRGGLDLKFRGEALSDAKIGQKIKMRLQIGARRVVEGHVVNAKTVLLD